MIDKVAFYDKLKKRLDDSTVFPAKYLYKFIVPANGNQANEVEELFINTGAEINTKKSNTGKYTSISILLNIDSSEDVILYYKKAEHIKGIISL